MHGKEALLTNAATPELEVIRAIQHIYESHPDAMMQQFSRFELATQATAMLCFAARGGLILKPTPALETLLGETDIGDGLPTAMFKPLAPVVYLEFGPLWKAKVTAQLGKVITLSGLEGREYEAAGCYLIQSTTHCDGCHRYQRTIGLYLVIAITPQANEALDALHHFPITGGVQEVLHDEELPIHETLVRKLIVDFTAEAFKDLMPMLVGMLAKVFLYRWSEDSQFTEHKDYSEQERRLHGLGSRKADKLSRRLPRLYDWMALGPAGLVGESHGHGEVSPHWRKGHFRLQPHGADRLLRKLIFIAPTMVRADRLMS